MARCSAKSRQHSVRKEDTTSPPGREDTTSSPEISEPEVAQEKESSVVARTESDEEVVAEYKDTLDPTRESPFFQLDAQPAQESAQIGQPIPEVSDPQPAQEPAQGVQPIPEVSAAPAEVPSHTAQPTAPSQPIEPTVLEDGEIEYGPSKRKYKRQTIADRKANIWGKADV